MFVNMESRSSLNHNPPVASISITTRGADWAWTVFCIMAVSAFGMIIWRHFRAPGTRIFHNFAVFILLVSSICWFGMASDLGAAPVSIEFARGNEDFTGPTRAIWYVKYIQYFINVPLLLSLVTLATGLPLSDVLYIAFLGVVSVVSGLVGALVPSTYKWGFYVFAVVADLYILFHLWVPARRSISDYGLTSVSGAHVRGVGLLTLLFILYPIAWGLSEGGNKIAPDSEFIFYGILDIFLFPVFLFAHIYQLANVDFERFSWWGTGVGPAGNTEKPRV